MTTWALSTTANGQGYATTLAPSYLEAGWYDVWGRQIVNAQEGPWSGPFRVKVLAPVRRFEPMYWHINMPLTISACVRTLGSNTVRLDAILRKKSDLVGMKWSSKDEWDHLQIGYLQSNNYVDCVLAMDYAVTGLDDPDLVMTVKDDEGVDYFIRLANYRTSGDLEAGHLKFDFAGKPVYGGFDVEDAGQRVNVPWNRIVEFSISLASPDYDKEDDTPLETPLAVSLTLSNISVTGGNAYVPRRSSGPPETDIRMCDGYDDSYNLCPERIVQALNYLGYSGQYVLYIGATHLHDLVWSDTQGSFVVNPAHPISAPSRLWFADFFDRLLANGFVPVVSQSYEILAEFCPTSWRQQSAQSTTDPAGPYAMTGWDPPSTLVSPCNPDAMDYLKAVALQVCGILEDAGGTVHYQIGEPWWWDGSYSGSGPCIYDPLTRAQYTSETSNAVPTPYLMTVAGSIGASGDYVDWCSEKLGNSTLWLRDAVLDEYPTAKTYILLFTPQILNPASEITNRLNLPIASWESPAFDVLQLEDYDWVVEGDWANHARTLTAGTDTLGYSLDNIQYFGGFNLLHETADEVWANITQAIDGALTWGVAEVCVWARPQVFRDGWFPTGRLAPELGLSPDPGPDYVEPVYVQDLQAHRTDFGDIRLSFDPNQDTTNKTFYVDVYDVSGTTVKRTFTLTSPRRVNGRVLCDYPIEYNSVDHGFPPTYLVFAVRVNTSDPVGTIVAGIPTDNSIVKKAIAFCGQSNVLGHFTTLSGDTIGEGSAAYFRRLLADALGLSWIEVMPLQWCWGSSAADKLADDDPVSGVNHWYDLDGSSNGPRLTTVLGYIDALSIPVSAIIWSQGENDASAMQPAAAPRFSNATRYRAATEKIFAALRAKIGSSTPIWIQTTGRGYWGELPDPPEAGGEYYKIVRDTQATLATVQNNTYIGSWVPGCETIDGYVPEVGNPGFIHYTKAVYWATAKELADSIANNLDRINLRPDWTTYTAPVLTPSADDYDVHIDWGAPNGSKWYVANINVTTGDLIEFEGYENPKLVTASGGTGSWVFTGPQQVATYGYAGGYVQVRVWRQVGSVKGPEATLVVNPADLPGHMAAPSGLDAHKSGSNIVVTWTGASDGTWHVRNLRVDNNELIWEGNVSGPSFTFTAAQQTAEYGFTTNYISVYVSKVASGDLQGPEAYYTEDLS